MTDSAPISRLVSEFLSLLEEANRVAVQKECGCPKHLDLLDDIRLVAETEGFEKFDAYQEWLRAHESQLD